MSLIPNYINQVFFKSLFSLLIGKDQLRFYETIDWSQSSAGFHQTDFNYPLYYSSQNFHGILGGYLNPVAAITYDFVTALASPPHEAWTRQQLISNILGQPQTVLDLGCGTGSTTLLLKQAFRGAVVTGLDLSPYMLVLANYKAQQQQLNIRWLHGLSEDTGFETATIDLVTASFLLHETPPEIAQLILQECFRLVKPGGQLILLDGNQKRLSHLQWLIKIFQEPYSKLYAAGNLDVWMKTAGFEQVQTKPVGWLNQITQGIKPNNFASCRETT
ncbi:class I SAM-dependent methyltransferase [Nostoc flagelliforme]|nr:class I SAM-dependent methyltransferase [Nostoc flagelliforme]